MEKHLVIAGGGHAHMMTLARLQKFVRQGFRVTVVGPSDHHYYSGMGPGMLGGIYGPEEIRFNIRKIVEKGGGTFVRDRVTGVDPNAKKLILETNKPVSYDAVSFNLGSQVFPFITGKDERDVFTVKPIDGLIAAQRQVLEQAAEKKIRIGIVGGGPAAVEIAGNLHGLVRRRGGHMPDIHIFPGKKLLPRVPERVREFAVRSLEKRGIRMSENGYAREVKTNELVLESGERFESDIIFLAHGITPSPVFRESGLPTGPDGGLWVNSFLQCADYPDIFGGGDCIHFGAGPLDKVGVYAVRQNPVLYHNLMARLKGRSLLPFHPGGAYLLILNMGDGTGILWKKGHVFKGRTAFWIKNFIDRRFMRKYR